MSQANLILQALEDRLTGLQPDGLPRWFLCDTLTELVKQGEEPSWDEYPAGAAEYRRHVQEQEGEA